MSAKDPTDWRRISQERQREKMEKEALRDRQERDLLSRSLEVRDILVSMGIEYYGLPWYHESMKDEELEDKRIENYEDCFAEFHPFIDELVAARDSGVFESFWINTDLGTKSCSSVTEIAGRDEFGNKIIIVQCRDGEIRLGE